MEFSNSEEALLLVQLVVSGLSLLQGSVGRPLDGASGEIRTRIHLESSNRGHLSVVAWNTAWEHFLQPWQSEACVCSRFRLHYCDMR